MISKIFFNNVRYEQPEQLRIPHKTFTGKHPWRSKDQ